VDEVENFELDVSARIFRVCGSVAVSEGAGQRDGLRRIVDAEHGTSEIA
jgi:hypothetical protein